MQINFEAGIVLCLITRTREELERMCLQGARYFLVGPWTGPTVGLEIGRCAGSPGMETGQIGVAVEVEPLLHFPDEPEPTGVHIAKPRPMLLGEVADVARRLTQEWEGALKLRNALLLRGYPVPNQLHCPVPPRR